jgi:hypothetical protein
MLVGVFYEARTDYPSRTHGFTPGFFGVVFFALFVSVLCHEPKVVRVSGLSICGCPFGFLLLLLVNSKHKY